MQVGMRAVALGLVALSLGACGRQGLAVPASQAQAQALRARAVAPMAFRAAADLAIAHASKTWPGTWQVTRSFGEKAWAADGSPKVATWRMHLLGQRKGLPGFHYVKLWVSPEGKVTLTNFNPEGPFADPWHTDREPLLDLSAMIPVEQGLKTALASRLGTDYGVETEVSFESDYTSRLKRYVLRYKWNGRKWGSRYACEVLLDPKTGEVVELNADKWID